MFLIKYLKKLKLNSIFLLTKIQFNFKMSSPGNISYKFKLLVNIADKKLLINMREKMSNITDFYLLTHTSYSEKQTFRLFDDFRF